MKDKQKRARWLKKHRQAVARRAAREVDGAAAGVEEPVREPISTVAAGATEAVASGSKHDPRRGPGPVAAPSDPAGRRGMPTAESSAAGANGGPAIPAGRGQNGSTKETRTAKAGRRAGVDAKAQADAPGEPAARGVEEDLAELDPLLGKLDAALAGLSDAAVARLFHELSADAARSERAGRRRAGENADGRSPEGHGSAGERDGAKAPGLGQPSAPTGQDGSKQAHAAAEGGPRRRDKGGSRGDPVEAGEAPERPEPPGDSRPGAGSWAGPPPEVTPDLVIRVARRIWDGAPVREAIEAEGVSEPRFYSRTTLDPELRTVARCMGFTGVGPRIEQRILREAVVGRSEPIYFDGQEVGEKRVYSDGLLIWLLQRYLPEKYGKGDKQAERDRRELDRLAPDAAARAKEIGLLAAEAAFERALEGVARPVFRRGELVGTIRVYSERLLKFLLLAERRGEMLPELETPPPTSPATGEPRTEPDGPEPPPAPTELPDKTPSGPAATGPGTSELPNTVRASQGAQPTNEIPDTTATVAAASLPRPNELPDTGHEGSAGTAPGVAEIPDNA